MNMTVDYLQCAKFHDGVYFFCFRPEKPFLSKFGPKSQRCQFKLNFGPQTKSRMQN